MKPGAETPDPKEPDQDLDGEPGDTPARLASRFSAQSLIGSPVPGDRPRVTPPGASPRAGIAGAPPGPGSVLCPRCREESPSGAEFCERCGLSFLETRAIELASPASASPGAAGLVGQTINDKYRVLSILGEGGFGVVYKVELLLFDRANIFALKLLHPGLSRDTSFRRRFLREAGLALTLIHENTIQIREFGQMDDGHLFFTMDYCEGEPLKAVIAREGFLTVPRALHVARQILSVLKHAHERGILHRDLKPENIFLESSPGRDFVKVGDFGLAKSFDPVGEPGTPRGRAARAPGGEDITRGGIVGTPRYMSPEQALGKDDLDQRSDLYSVGVILYEMLYGSVPPERVVFAAAVSVQLKTPASLPGHAVPRDVWGVLRRALEVRREDRFQSAEEFLEALDSLPSYMPVYVGARSRSRVRVWLGRAVAVAAAIGLVWLSGQVFLSLQRNGEGGAAGGGEPGTRGSPEAAGVSPDGKGASVDLEAKARAVEPARLSPFPREGVLAFLQFKKGDVLRYECYREGLVHDRDVTYTVVDAPEPEAQDPAVYTLKVTPGERTVTWSVDAQKNEFTQTWLVPHPETGELIEPGSRLWLKLPQPDAVIDGDYIEKELRVHAQRVDLVPPQRHPGGEALTGCLRVESREEERTHYHYYKEGKGLVAIEVYEIRPAAPAASPPAQAPREAGAVPPAAVPPGAAPREASSGKPLQILVYARYLVQG